MVKHIRRVFLPNSILTSQAATFEILEAMLSIILEVDQSCFSIARESYFYSERMDVTGFFAYPSYRK